MIAAVVLAAGASRRYGGHKLLAPLLGRPVVRWTVEAALASPVQRVVVVLGREPDRVRSALAALPVELVENPDFAAGMSTSLRAGVAALGESADAAVILLGDQPTVTPEIIGALVEAHRRTGALVVAPSYRGEPGNPVLFGAALFGELLAVRGDQGARGVVALDPARVARVELPHSPPPDVDTPADRDAVERLLARGVHGPDLPRNQPPERGAG